MSDEWKVGLLAVLLFGWFWNVADAFGDIAKALNRIADEMQKTRTGKKT